MSDGQTKVYAGRLALGEVSEQNPHRFGDVWVQGDKAVFFEVGTAALVELDGAAVALDGDGRLVLTGTTDGEPVTWSALNPVRVQRTANRVKVAFSEGDVWNNATLTETNYGVTLSLVRQEPRAYAGARFRQLNTKNAEIVLLEGGTLPVQLNTKRGCGCGSK
jgi:hypothetical protein